MILIADDSDGKIMMLKALLHKAHAKDDIVVAHTTEEAARLIDAHAPTMAFIDYEMPSEQGPAVIAHLRTAVPEAKIAMVSSCNLDAYREDAFAAGADAYVCSSFAADDVERNILGILEEWKVM